MLASRALLRQSGSLLEKSLECWHVAGDNCRGCRLELCYRRVPLGELLDMLDQPGPAHEPVGTSNHELRVGQRTLAFPRKQLPCGELRDSFDPSLILDRKAGSYL